MIKYVELIIVTVGVMFYSVVGYSQQEVTSPDEGETICFDVEQDQVVAVFVEYLISSFDGTELTAVLGNSDDYYYFSTDDANEEQSLNVVLPSGVAYEVPHDKTLRVGLADDIRLIDGEGCDEMVALLGAGSSAFGTNLAATLGLIGIGYLLSGDDNNTQDNSSPSAF